MCAWWTKISWLHVSVWGTSSRDHLPGSRTALGWQASAQNISVMKIHCRAEQMNKQPIICQGKVRAYSGAKGG